MNKEILFISADFLQFNQFHPVTGFIGQNLYHIQPFLVRTQIDLRRVALQNRFSGHVENSPVEVVAILSCLSK